MGFIRWLYIQYKEYKLEQIFKTASSAEEKDRLAKENYLRCLEEGFTSSQILALANLFYDRRINKDDRK